MAPHTTTRVPYFHFLLLAITGNSHVNPTKRFYFDGVLFALAWWARARTAGIHMYAFQLDTVAEHTIGVIQVSPSLYFNGNFG